MLWGARKDVEVTKIAVKRSKKGELNCEIRFGLFLGEGELDELDIGKTGFATKLSGTSLDKKKVWIGQRKDDEKADVFVQLTELPSVVLKRPEVKREGLGHMLFVSLCTVLADPGEDDATLLSWETFQALVKKLSRTVVVQFDEIPPDPDLFSAPSSGKKGKKKGGGEQ